MRALSRQQRDDIERLEAWVARLAVAAEKQHPLEAWEAVRQAQTLLTSIERRTLAQALEQGVTITQIARQAGVTRQAVSRRLNAWGLSASRQSGAARAVSDL